MLNVEILNSNVKISYKNYGFGKNIRFILIFSEYLNHLSKESTCISLKIKKPGTAATVSNVPRFREYGYSLSLNEPSKLPNIKTSIIFNPVILLILYLFKGTLRIIGTLFILY